MLTARGKVSLVGAGPGDPELLTLKALNRLKTAEVVVYDRLVSPEILAMIPRGATLICVGKASADHPVPQDDINALLVRLAGAGRTVVRLKGGDPFIFGRGSEEAAELRSNGIEVEVVPGITSAQGCAAATGVPLTHRGLATGVRYLTGHCRQDRELDFDWPGLANPETTLVVYMGLANIAEITDRLIAGGMAATMPVLAVSRGTTPRQREVLAPLTGLPEAVVRAGLEPPVLFIIGKVAGLAAGAGAIDRDRVRENADVVSA